MNKLNNAITDLKLIMCVKQDLSKTLVNLSMDGEATETPSEIGVL